VTSSIVDRRVQSASWVTVVNGQIVRGQSVRFSGPPAEPERICSRTKALLRNILVEGPLSLLSCQDQIGAKTDDDRDQSEYDVLGTQ